MAELNPNRTKDTPGNQFRNVEAKLDYDGVKITSTRLEESTERLNALTIRETVSGGVWTWIENEPISDLLCFQVTNKRTVPGEWVPFTRYDENLGPVQGRRRLVEFTTQKASLTATKKITYEQRQGSSLVAYEVEETWSDGSGGAGNPAYPVQVTDFYEVDRGAVRRTTQLVTDLVSSASLTAPSTTIIETEYEAYNEFLRRKIIETWTAPGPEIERNIYDDKRGNVREIDVLVKDTTSTATISESSNVVTEVFYQPYNDLVRKKTTRTYTLPGPQTERNAYDPQKGNVRVLEQLVADTTTASSITIAGSPQEVATEISYEPFNDVVRNKVTQTFNLPGPERVRRTVDEAETRLEVTIKSELVKAPTAAYTQTPGNQIEYNPLNDKYGEKITTTIGDGDGDIPSREEYKFIDYTFPAVLIGITTYPVTARDGSAQLVINPIRRSAFNRLVAARVQIDYAEAGTLTLPTVFAPELADCVFNGVAISVNERNVICNEIYLYYSSGTENPKWPYFVEEVTFNATSLTADDYVSQIGSEVCIGAAIKPWRCGLDRMEAVYITLQ